MRVMRRPRMAGMAPVALLPVAAFVVHQLRFLLAFGRENLRADRIPAIHARRPRTHHTALVHDHTAIRQTPPLRR